jgi:hypothetical protein
MRNPEGYSDNTILTAEMLCDEKRNTKSAGAFLYKYELRIMSYFAEIVFYPLQFLEFQV